MQSDNNIIYLGPWIIWKAELDGHEVVLRENMQTGARQILLNEEFAHLCGKRNIEDLMADDGVLDLANELWKLKGEFPLLTEKEFYTE